MKGILLLFYDYDTQWGADHSRRPGGPRQWGHLEFKNTERLLEIHSRFNVPACFAVVGASALPGERPYHDPQQIRQIHEAGHEVASHGMYHEWLPALGREDLLKVLRTSKDALEQCIGNSVVTFVPPYNQPFDYPKGLSFSLSERRICRKGPRTDLQSLCAALKEVGYRFCRVAYRPIYIRLAETLLRRHIYKPVQLENISGILCVRINTPCGFAGESLRMLDQVANKGGIAVVYAHPHSLSSQGPQSERFLLPFLEKVKELRENGKLHVALPRELAI